MSEKILITPLKLENAAIRMRAAGAEFANSVIDCNTAMRNLGSTWRDELYTIANGRYDSLVGGLLVDIPETLNAFADMIADSLRAFETNDEETRNIIMNMPFPAAVKALMGPGLLTGNSINPMSTSDPPVERENSETALGALMRGQLEGDEINRNPNNLVFEDLDYYRSTFAAQKGNCAEFARDFISHPDKNSLPRPWIRAGQGYRLGQHSNFNELGYLSGSPQDLKGSDIWSLFKDNNAQIGDVVQMRWNNGGIQNHSAIIKDFDFTNGTITFLHGGINENIRINTYSFDELAGYVNGADNSGISVTRISV